VATEAPPLLELVDATVVKDGVRILDRLTLSIRDGEHTAILGPNGAGKTTLINLLTHDDYPCTGEPDGDAHVERAPAVRVLGDSHWNVFDLRTRLGIISSDLHARFVSGNNAGSIRGEDAVVSGFFATQGFLVNLDVTLAMRVRARAALEGLDAGHLAEKRMDRMSTGEARRVLIARALIGEPRALVLDEPSVGLDLVAQRRFLEMVRSVAQRGTTIVLITHHVEEIFPEIGHVILLQRGRVMDAGPKRAMLTPHHLGALFGIPVQVTESDGYFQARMQAYPPLARG
jgi:iron complex transport system ATP-binding protein